MRPHISVCICTYKRPDFLKQLLGKLGGQDTAGQFTYSIVIADNDESQSAKASVMDFAAASIVPIKYCVEPRQNIALARNKAIENANGDYIAFIDDDEFPTEHWLLNLFQACNRYEVDGVLGPVKRYFDEEPPKWIIKGSFYDRPTFPTGSVVEWPKGRTGNLLLNKKVLLNEVQPFRPKFRSGEDQDFFHRMIDKGHVFIWCAEAVVYEIVPRFRWKRTVMLKRALLRGASTVHYSTFGTGDIVKSLIAVPTYTAALPFALLLGHHRFMILLIKVFDHLGKLVMLLGINPIKEHYITENSLKR